MLVKRGLPVFAFVAATFVAAGAVGVGPLNPVFYRPISISANGGLATVDIRPIPEGPQPKSRPPIALIEPYIPDPLPAPQFQWFVARAGIS